MPTSRTLLWPCARTISQSAQQTCLDYLRVLGHSLNRFKWATQEYPLTFHYLVLLEGSKRLIVVNDNWIAFRNPVYIINNQGPFLRDSNSVSQMPRVGVHKEVSGTKTPCRFRLFWFRGNFCWVIRRLVCWRYTPTNQHVYWKWTIVTGPFLLKTINFQQIC